MTGIEERTRLLMATTQDARFRRRPARAGFAARLAREAGARAVSNCADRAVVAAIGSRV
jgi:hypothetical protein